MNICTLNEKNASTNSCHAVGSARKRGTLGPEEPRASDCLRAWGRAQETMNHIYYYRP